MREDCKPIDTALEQMALCEAFGMKPVLVRVGWLDYEDMVKHACKWETKKGWDVLLINGVRVSLMLATRGVDVLAKRS